VRTLSALVLLCGLQVSGQALSANAERASSILKEGIENKNPDVRIQAIVAGSMIGRTEAIVKRLAAALQDKDIQVRITTIRALQDMKSQDAVPALERTLKEDQVPEVAFAAATALYVLKDPAGRKALMDVYDGKVSTRSNYLKIKTRGMMREFHSFQSGAMFIVSQGIGYVPIPGVGEGFTAMTDLLSDPDLSAKASILLLLARDKDPQSLDLIKQGLADSDWSVRASAAQLIATMAKRDLRESLVPLFDDKKEKVRFRAAGAYLHLYLLK
jgi:HEAT repeat protein